MAENRHRMKGWSKRYAKVMISSYIDQSTKSDMKEVIKILGISQSDYIRSVLDRANRKVLDEGKM
ncbi:hypothetical protein [Desulfogranum japonicum]|uniref:hypothetical protein n=1 Tax=Desulfogranum japonicum TaxID=231447 RepID=UPI00048BB155|nr:hypothetical protein [Desulfogranum japonicum]